MNCSVIASKDSVIAGFTSKEKGYSIPFQFLFSSLINQERLKFFEVKVIPPAVALAIREGEERLREMRLKAGLLSVTMWQQQVGLDPKHEAANFEAEARRRGG